MPQRTQGIDGVRFRRGRKVDFLRTVRGDCADELFACRHDKAPVPARRRTMQQLQKTGRIVIQPVEIGASAVAAPHADRRQSIPRRAPNAQKEADAYAAFIYKKAAGKQHKAKSQQHKCHHQQHARPARKSFAHTDITRDGAGQRTQAADRAQKRISQHAGHGSSHLFPEDRRKKDPLAALRALAGLCFGFVTDWSAEALLPEPAWQSVPRSLLRSRSRCSFRAGYQSA